MRHWAMILSVLLFSSCTIFQNLSSSEAVSETGIANRWQTGATMPIPTSEMPAAVLDGRIYVAGGFGGETLLQSYDPAADQWHQHAEMPEGRHHLMSVAHGDLVYVLGGALAGSWQPMRNNWTYDPAADQWTALAPLPEPRMSGAAVLIDDAIYVVGGIGGRGNLLRYEPATDHWTSLAAPMLPREHVAAVAMDGQLYLLAGRWQQQAERNTAERYDPATNRWHEVPAMAEARAGFGAALLDGEIIVAGGEVFTGGRNALTTVERYDPSTQQWSSGPSLPVGLHGVPAAVVDDTLYLLGGSDVAGAIENEGRVLIWSPSENRVE